MPKVEAMEFMVSPDWICTEEGQARLRELQVGFERSR